MYKALKTHIHKNKTTIICCLIVLSHMDNIILYTSGFPMNLFLAASNNLNIAHHIQYEFSIFGTAPSSLSTILQLYFYPSERTTAFTVN